MNEYAAMILAAVAAFGVTALLGFVFIPWLHKLKFGQIILDIGPNWHKHKQGTPTMGGLMFIAGVPLAVIAAFATDALMGGRMLSHDGDQSFTVKLIAGMIMALLFGVMGFLDDYMKVVKKRNKGLSIGQKTLMQLIISGGYLYSLWLSMDGRPYTLIPFLTDANGNSAALFLGWFFWPFGIAVLYAATNAVNFTDGIDGLCSSVTMITGAGLAAFAVMRGMFGAGIVAAALAGGCAGFLMWNRPKAKVFMGDTGSMFIGGLVVAVAFALDTPVILLLMGIIYVIEGLSDVIQIGYFKLTGGKRIFKMAPIHHHFEMSGWSEKKIDIVFSLVNIAGVAAGLVLVYFGLPGFLA